MIERNLEALRPLLSGVGFGIATVADFEELPLYPEEAQYAQTLWPRRRCDFWMGRSAARRAMMDLAKLNRTTLDKTIVAGPVRADKRWPTFPRGTVGSVSHSGGIAVSIAGSAARFRSLGIDLELRPLPASAARLVLNSGEIDWFSEGKCTCAEAFSAKEAAFKALDPLLDGGAPPLRQIQLVPTNGGFEVRWPAHPQMHSFVSIHHLRGGILAWTAICQSGPCFSDVNRDTNDIGRSAHDFIDSSFNTDNKSRSPAAESLCDVRGRDPCGIPGQPIQGRQGDPGSGS